MTAGHEPGFYLDDRWVEPSRCVIIGPEGEARLEPKVMDVLVYLAGNAGQVVSREELISKLWRGTIVTDEVLSRCIYRLRQDLGDDSKAPRFIETVPKKGYRLITQVRRELGTAPAAIRGLEPESDPTAKASGTPASIADRLRRISPSIPVLMGAFALLVYLLSPRIAEDAAEEASQRAARVSMEAPVASDPARVSRKSIAVLPFVNTSDDPENDYFCDGISDELITLLGKKPDLKVVARTSSFAFKNEEADIRRIARQLGVRHIVEGSVRRASDRIRVSAQLVDADTGYQLWSDAYDRKFEDVFAVQDEIASAIVGALQDSLAASTNDWRTTTRVPPTRDMTAYRLYLQGQHHWKRRGETSIRKSIELFKAAIERDPGFAQPHSALAAAYLVLPFHSQALPDATFALADAAARQALALDASLGQAHAVLAVLNLRNWNWAAADEAFRRALSTAPNDATTHQWYSEFLGNVGYADQSLLEALKAHELDPVSPVVNDRLGVAYLWAGEDDLAAEQFRIASELGLNRDTYNEAYMLLLLRQGKVEEATLLYERILHRLGLRTGWVRPVAEAVVDPAKSNHAMELTSQGGPAGDLPPPIIFAVAVLLQQNDSAFSTATRMLDDRTLAAELLFAPEARALRQDTRFPALLAEIGLVDYWREQGWPKLCAPQRNTAVCR